ncbi:MAG: hypothetical protein A3A80_01160 [Candidatus Terrybacteria bacterium RIFCSPLOWO2_01_FULL_44_24]|uniref:Uncharacterized protein n=1 Tax=Candidatus Terrybacteria bacterium RIFCSPHIGHO2_01_FULL_43_35 TaxID=1802361 RepID=A0A1G2PF97_9BACT|nr:MAG: hypothetical protein A2828_03540 [Candidatus Terrybacteria bacterium RIFCSPHIGHO2_01_FULL_43_35]OHA50402.1 MAG: hypothetical protein A3B75_02600 [Candidatus Terrybacteria bacterium RIFCSPHIGHO2_02_FULL_43_14]OHA51692.1 MAG: hypothetical protein A3A80_01160 [Candidatus Terrybacteria bacterium RIFCSPLOWO2_01_FULL_44_24]
MKFLFLRPNNKKWGWVVLRWAFVCVLVILSALAVKEKLTVPAPYNSNYRPLSEQTVPFTVESSGPDVGVYSRTLDFGKGKFISLWVHPPGEDLRIEKLRVRKEGATDAEMPYAWLRLNGIRVYVRVPFVNDVAVFSAFPPKDISSFKYEGYKDAQEEQKLLLDLEDLPYIAPASGQTSTQIYGQFAPDIAPREQRQGIRFCLEEISGTLLPSGRRALTSFAAPVCFSRMGISL